MNIWDILILAVIGLALFGAVRLYRGRRKGRCGGCCAECGTAACRCAEQRKEG